MQQSTDKRKVTARFIQPSKTCFVLHAITGSLSNSYSSTSAIFLLFSFRYVCISQHMSLACRNKHLYTAFLKFLPAKWSRTINAYGDVSNSISNDWHPLYSCFIRNRTWEHTSLPPCIYWQFSTPSTNVWVYRVSRYAAYLAEAPGTCHLFHFLELVSLNMSRCSPFQNMQNG